MSSENMTSTERIAAAIRLEKPDRVPIAPLMSTAAAAVLTGQDPCTLAVAGGHEKLDAELRAFDEYGGWHGVPAPVPTPLDAWPLIGMKVRPATRDRPEVQVVEEENTRFEDYDIIAEIGWDRFVTKHLVYRITDWTRPEEVRKAISDFNALRDRSHAEYRKRGAVLLFPAWDHHPFFLFSLTRSMVKFTEDLYYRPEKVLRALNRAVDEFIQVNIDRCKATGIPFASCNEERAGAYFYPLAVFERFWWPSVLKIVDAWWSEGIVTWFHVDTPWDKNLPYFKQLPKGSAVLDLDGTTNVFAAKDLLRGHLCIASDVHPTLLSLGKPEEVEAYCKKLIEEVGGDGGHILSSGCTLPGAIKPENFKAMIETGKTYELSMKR